MTSQNHHIWKCIVNLYPYLANSWRLWPPTICVQISVPKLPQIQLLFCMSFIAPLSRISHVTCCCLLVDSCRDELFVNGTENKKYEIMWVCQQFEIAVQINILLSSLYILLFIWFMQCECDIISVTNRTAALNWSVGDKVYTSITNSRRKVALWLYHAR